MLRKGRSRPSTTTSTTYSASGPRRKPTSSTRTSKRVVPSSTPRTGNEPSPRGHVGLLGVGPRLQRREGAAPAGYRDRRERRRPRRAGFGLSTRPEPRREREPSE